MAGKKKKSKSKSEFQNVQTNDPWSPQIPYLTEGFARAKAEILDRPRTYYQGQLIADYDPKQIAAFNQIESRAGQGAPNIDAALGYNADVLSGKYLNANPHLAGAIDAATSGLARNYQRVIAPEIDSSFARAGRYGSGAAVLARSEAQNNLAQKIGEISSTLSYQDYNAERDRMGQASQLAPELYQSSFLPAQALLQIGSLRQQHEQEKINAEKEHHDFNQNEAYQRLAAYMALVNGNYGGTSTATGTNKTANTAPGASVLDQINQGIGTASNLFGLFRGFS